MASVVLHESLNLQTLNQIARAPGLVVVGGGVILLVMHFVTCCSRVPYALCLNQVSRIGGWNRIRHRIY